MQQSPRQIRFNQPQSITRQFKIDGTTINKYTLHQMITKSHYVQSSQITFGQVFKLCQKLQQYEEQQLSKGPKDVNLKIQIKQIINNKLLSQQQAMHKNNQIKNYKIGFDDRIYPLNKPGNFGRVLQRKCRIVPKGVMQFQQNKQSKLKQVKNFINKVEHVQNKQLTDLAWISTQPQKYKFRIILLDNNDSKKGIYFQSYEEAQKVRVYYVSKYRKQSLNSTVFGSLKYRLLESNMNSFVQRISLKNEAVLLNLQQKKNIKKSLFKDNKYEPQKLSTQKMESLLGFNQKRLSRNQSQSLIKLQNSQINKQTGQLNKQASQKHLLSQSIIQPVNVNNESSLNKSSQQLYLPTATKNNNVNNKNTTNKSFMSGFLDDLISQNKDIQYINNNEGNLFMKINNATKINDRIVDNIQKLNQAYRDDFFLKWRDNVNQKKQKYNSQNKNAQGNSRFNKKAAYHYNRNNNINNSQESDIEEESFPNIGAKPLISRTGTQMSKSPYQRFNKANNINGNDNQNNIAQSLRSNSLNPKNRQQNNFSKGYQRQKSPLRIQQPESRASKRLGHSRKQESIFILPEQANQQNDEENQKGKLDSNKPAIKYRDNKKLLGTQRIIFKSIQFLQNLNLAQINSVNNKQNLSKNSASYNLLFFKPIITITAYKKTLGSIKGQNQQQSGPFSRTKTNKFSEQKSMRSRSRINDKRGQFIFNTIVKKVDTSTIQYELLPTQGQNSLQCTQQNFKQYYLTISIINFLTNEQIFQSEFLFKNYYFHNNTNNYAENDKNIIVDKKSKLRLKFQYKNTGVVGPETVYNAASLNAKKNANLTNKNTNTKAGGNANVKMPSATLSPYSESNLFLSFPKIDPAIIQKIKTYWQSQAVSNSYYNLQDNFNIFDAVSNSSNQAQPSNWWIDLQQIQYNYLCILQSSSLILGYKLIKPMLYLIKAVKNLKAFRIQTVIEMLLSIIINLGKYYYFTEQLQKLNYLHRQIGLKKGKIQYQNRVMLEIMLFQRIFIIQNKQLAQKFQRKNICISHLMMEYVYELFSQNLELSILIDFWNYCSQQIEKVPLVFFLTTISLCRLLKEYLIDCKNLKDVKDVLQQKKYITSSSLLLADIKHLESKYFFKGTGFIEQIKQAFEQKPFELLLKQYLKRIQQNQLQAQNNKVKFKKQLCSRILEILQFDEALKLFSSNPGYNNANFNGPNFSNKKYVLHIYFYKLPQSAGKLLLVSGQNQYESISSEKNRYFIIGEISQSVYLKYIDYKGNVFKGQLTFIQGFNEFKIKIRRQKKVSGETVPNQSLQDSYNKPSSLSSNQNDQQVIHYLCGLITEPQIQIIKSPINKKYLHYLGPNIQSKYWKQQMMKPLKQIRVSNPNSNSIQRQLISEQWFKDLRNIFSYGSKSFNQIEYFLYLLGEYEITLQEKIIKIYQYSMDLAMQNFLCHNKILFKHLLFQFIKMSFYPTMRQQQFQCYINASLEQQFNAPKIIKCRFFYQNIEIKLEKQLIQYHCKKMYTHLYGDLYVTEIIAICQPFIKARLTSMRNRKVNQQQQTGLKNDEMFEQKQANMNMNNKSSSQAELKILYSTYGSVKLKIIPIKISQNKQITVDFQRQSNQTSIVHQISQKQPEILMTEIMPSFSKISTILDYVNTKRNIDLKNKVNQQQRKVIPESINLLKYIQPKLKQCILMDYSQYPSRKIHVPFYGYFYQLKYQEKQKPKFKYYYMNNVKQSIKSVCTCKQNLKFSTNNKQQDLEFERQLGLFGNFRKIRRLQQNAGMQTNYNSYGNTNMPSSSNKINSVFFWTQHREQNNESLLSQVSMNYGYGIYRWQKCMIKKYRKKYKQRVGAKKLPPPKRQQRKFKIQYLVEHKYSKDKYYAREYEVRLNPKVKDSLQEIDQDIQNKFNQVQKDIKDGFSFLLNMSNLQGFLKSVGK